MASQSRWKNISWFFSLRYELGYRYLDRCGEVMVSLELDHGYIPGDTVPQGAKLEYPDDNIFAEFDSTELKIRQEPPLDGGKGLLRAASLLSGLIVDEFAPATPVYAGFRCQSYLPFEREDQLHRATLQIDAGAHMDLAAALSLAPSSQCSKHIFTSGSYELSAHFQEVSLTSAQRPTFSAGFSPTERSLDVVRRKKESMARIESVESFGLLLDLDLKERQPVGQDFEEQFALVKKYQEIIQKRYTISP